MVMGLLWPHPAVWAENDHVPSATTLRPIAWDTEKVLPMDITPLSPLYQVEGTGDGLTLGVNSQGAGAALLVWLEGEWAVAPWDGVDGGYHQSVFRGWLPDYLTVVELPTTAKGR